MDSHGFGGWSYIRIWQKSLNVRRNIQFANAAIMDNFIQYKLSLPPPNIFTANIAGEGDDIYHTLVMEDVNVSLFLEKKKGGNVDNHLLVSSTGRIDRVKMCLDLPVKEASQLKCVPGNRQHHTRLQNGVDAGTVAAAVKISGCWQLHIDQGEG